MFKSFGHCAVLDDLKMLQRTLYAVLDVRGCSTLLSRLSSVLHDLRVQAFASSIDWFINRDYDHHIHCGWHHHHHHHHHHITITITITIIFTVFLWRSWFFSSTLSSSPACASLSLWRKKHYKTSVFLIFVKFICLNFQILFV